MTGNGCSGSSGSAMRGKHSQRVSGSNQNLRTRLFLIGLLPLSWRLRSTPTRLDGLYLLPPNHRGIGACG